MSASVKHADYEITTFERKPGLWRASIVRKRAWTRTQGKVMLSFVTNEDADSEKGAEKMAAEEIGKLSI